MDAGAEVRGYAMLYGHQQQQQVIAWLSGERCGSGYGSKRESRAPTWRSWRFSSLIDYSHIHTSHPHRHSHIPMAQPSYSRTTRHARLDEQEDLTNGLLGNRRSTLPPRPQPLSTHSHHEQECWIYCPTFFQGQLYVRQMKHLTQADCLK